jgi:heptaprenylglyceryl phosphate synthase
MADETDGIIVDGTQDQPEEQADATIDITQPNPNNALTVDNTTAVLENLLLEAASYVKKARA